MHWGSSTMHVAESIKKRFKLYPILTPSPHCSPFGERVMWTIIMIYASFVLLFDPHPPSKKISFLLIAKHLMLILSAALIGSGR